MGKMHQKLKALGCKRNTSFIVSGEKQGRMGKDINMWMKNGMWKWIEKFQDIERVPMY